MDIEKVEKANKLLSEIKDLKKYNSLFFGNKQAHTAHFEIRLHYGDLHNSEIIQISRNHNNRLINEINKIISELEKELKEL